MWLPSPRWHGHRLHSRQKPPPASGRREENVLKSRPPPASETTDSNCPFRSANSFRWAALAESQNLSLPEELCGKTCEGAKVLQKARPVFASGRACRGSHPG